MEGRIEVAVRTLRRQWRAGMEPLWSAWNGQGHNPFAQTADVAMSSAACPGMIAGRVPGARGGAGYHKRPLGGSGAGERAAADLPYAALHGCQNGCGAVSESTLP